jgi:hypothetical protein
VRGGPYGDLPIWGYTGRYRCAQERRLGQLGWRRRNDRGRWPTGYRPIRRLCVAVEPNKSSISISILRNVRFDREDTSPPTHAPIRLARRYQPWPSLLGLAKGSTRSRS